MKLYIRTLLLAICLVALAVPSPARAAQPAAECDTVQGIVWRETGTASFSIHYPHEYEFIGQILSAQQQGEGLDLEYARFEALFEASLPLPVTIRIYPDLATYSCLNAQTGEVSPGSMHTHAGAREIALIGNNILANPSSWARNSTNIIRYELGVLFTKQVGGDQAPPGLLAAVGRYVQDPQHTIGYLQLQWQDWLEPTWDLRSLWEQASSQDLAYQLQATSTVAYLVDTYGWAAFLKFLHSLPGSQSPAVALARTYSMEYEELEAGWRTYYPRYFQGRWQTHPVYNYDLSPLQELIAAEQYSEADRKLQEVIAFLEKMGDPLKMGQAQALLYMARQGEAAVALFNQSQQAFQGGDYVGALALLEQARQRYAGTGNRYSHLDEFNAYHRQILKVVSAHGDLERLQSDISTHWNTFSLAAQLLSIGNQLSALGDVQGYERVKAMAQVVGARQREQYLVLAAGVFAIVLALLGALLRQMRTAPPPEAQL